MKLYIHNETGSVFQLIDGMVWGHPLYAAEDQILDLDVDKDLEWVALDPMSVTDDFPHNGKEVSSIKFEKIIRKALA